MKMYELFLDKQPLGIFKEQPEKVIYCDWTTDGFNLLCFKLDEWKRLQEKLGFTSTNDEYKNFNAIFDSKFCIEKNIEDLDELASELGFGVLEKFDDEKIEFAFDMQTKYDFYIDENNKTAGEANFFDWDMECEGIYQEKDYTSRWVLCDCYYEIEVNELKGDELAKFDVKKIDEEIIEVSYGCQIQGYNIVSVKELDRKNPKDDVKLLVWEDGNTERSFLEYRLENIKEEWKIR